MKEEYFLGIDIAKKTFDVALLNNNNYKHKIFNNNESGFETLLKWLIQEKVIKLHACLEATGSYGEALAYYLYKAGFKVSMINPVKIKGFAQCQLMRLKNDKADAILIANYCAVMKPKCWQPDALEVRQLQALVRRLDELIIAVNQEQNRLAVAPEIIQNSLQIIIKVLEEQIKIIQQQIQTHINNHSNLKQNAELLATIPGIGSATIAQVLAFMNPDRFANVKQFVAFIGLNPKQVSSGTSVRNKSHISKTGSASLRRAFYMPALVAMRYNPTIKAFCQRLKKAGKKGKVIVCGAMRKLIHIIYGVLKSKQPFKNNYNCLV